MVSTSWRIEPLELFDARQALRIGTYVEANAAINRLPPAYSMADEVFLVLLEILNAKGDFLDLQDAATRFLSADSAPSPAMVELLKLVLARCKMMIDMAMADYLRAALATWESSLKDVDLSICDKVTVRLLFFKKKNICNLNCTHRS